MNYWIFVHSEENVDETFQQLIKAGDFGFITKKPTRKKIESLKKYDVIIFYLGGSRGGYFSGEAKLTSDVHEPTREYIGRQREDRMDAMVDFGDVDLWGDKKVYLTDRSTRDKLDFIKNKDNWGMAVGQSVVKITEDDYKQIKSLL